MKLGTKVRHIRRNGDVITAKVTAKRTSERGDWLSIKGDVGGKPLTIWVRPSQVEVI